MIFAHQHTNRLKIDKLWIALMTCMSMKFVYAFFSCYLLVCLFVFLVFLCDYRCIIATTTTSYTKGVHTHTYTHSLSLFVCWVHSIVEKNKCVQFVQNLNAKWSHSEILQVVSAAAATTRLVCCTKSKQVLVSRLLATTITTTTARFSFSLFVD